jgi:hypothetical protein
MAFFSGCVIIGMQTALNASAGLIYPTDLRANFLWIARLGYLAEGVSADGL